MVDDSLIFNCSITGNLFAPSGERIGASCKVKDTGGKEMGDFSIGYSVMNGKNNVDFTMSKELFSNLVTDGIKIDKIIKNLDVGSLLGSIGNLIT